jgi:ABC-type transport system involved in Fe-S cluster assembly fused permease/ATPase subunit
LERCLIIILDKAISALASSKTVLMIAHRFGTIVDADHIIAMDKARISGLARHVELIENNVIYSELWPDYNTI